MFPIAAERGRIVGFGGRALGEARAKYLNTPDTQLFHKGDCSTTSYRAARARERREIVLAEGYMDVIVLDRAGVADAVAPLGTAVPSAQLAAPLAPHRRPAGLPRRRPGRPRGGAAGRGAGPAGDAGGKACASPSCPRARIPTASSPGTGARRWPRCWPRASLSQLLWRLRRRGGVSTRRRPRPACAGACGAFARLAADPDLRASVEASFTAARRGIPASRALAAGRGRRRLSRARAGAEVGGRWPVLAGRGSESHCRRSSELSRRPGAPQPRVAGRTAKSFRGGPTDGSRARDVCGRDTVVAW